MFFTNTDNQQEINQHRIETEVDYRTNFGDDLVVYGKVLDKRNGNSSVFRKRMEWRPGHKWGCVFEIPRVENQKNDDALDVEYKFLVWNNQKNIEVHQEDENCKHSVMFSENSPSHVKRIDQWNENSIQVM